MVFTLNVDKYVPYLEWLGLPLTRTNSALGQLSVYLEVHAVFDVFQAVSDCTGPWPWLGYKALGPGATCGSHLSMRHRKMLILGWKKKMDLH